RHDVDHRNLRRVPAHGSFGGQRRLAIEYHGHVRRRAAPVAGEHLAEPGTAGHERRSECARSRPGQHGRDRLLRDLGGRQHPAAARDSRGGPAACAPGGPDRPPPLDFMTYRGTSAGSRSTAAARYRLVLRLTAASTSVVIDRSYSRYSRSTSEEIDTTASGC